MFRPTLGLPPAHGCVLSPSALLRLPAALYGAGPARFRVFHKNTDSVGPEFSSSSQELDGRTLPGCMSLVSVRAPVGCMCLVSVLRSWPLAVTLPADVDHPESQEVFG